MMLASGTSTPTSITVVATRSRVSPAAKLVISAGLVTPEYPGVAAISDKAREADAAREAAREAEEAPDGVLQPAPSRRTA